MIEVSLHVLLNALNDLYALDSISRQQPAWVFDDEQKKAIYIARLNALLPILQELDLRLSVSKTTDMINVVTAYSVNGEFVAQTIASLAAQKLEELRDRIVGELGSRIVYVLPIATSSLSRTGAEWFWSDPPRSLIATSLDLEEAIKCYAMERNTACIFHLMRAMERAISVIGKKLKVTVIDKNAVDLDWGRMIANIATAVNAMPKGEKRERWSLVVSMLYHVKESWRNKTMHPRDYYTKVEAEAVLHAVKSFLNSMKGFA